MHRQDIINRLITKHKLYSYLEIGVSDGYCLNGCIADFKIGVDPNCEIYRNGNVTVLCQTSDEYFDELSDIVKFDVIFIDGLHVAEQVFKDITNSLKHLTEKGFIVVHDCNPPTKTHATPEYNGCDWNGTVYLGFLKAVKTHGLDYYTVNTDWGCGVITPKNVVLNSGKYESDIDWDYFNENRKELLNLISVEEFLKMVKL